jgi:hypothetical protein
MASWSFWWLFYGVTNSAIMRCILRLRLGGSPGLIGISAVIVLVSTRCWRGFGSPMGAIR